MKVLIVASKYLPEYTGASWRLQTLYKTLMREDPTLSVGVFCGGIEHRDEALYELDGITVRRLPDTSSGGFGRLAFYRDVLTTWRALEDAEFDVLHIVGTSAQTCAALHYAALKKIPAIVEMVTKGARPMQPLPVIGKLWKPSLKKRAAVVAISEALGAASAKAGYGAQTWVRPNPVDETRFYPAPARKAAIRAELLPFAAPEDIVLLMIAKFMPQKNQIFLPDIIARLPAHYKLVLAGPVVNDGPLAARDQAYFAQLTARLENRALKGRVHVIPSFIDRPEDYMRASDIYLMPNIDEGLGTPLLEAQACGLPVIANAAEEAFVPHIQEGQTGFLRPLEPKAWVEAVQACAKLSPDALQARGDFVREQYGLRKTAGLYKDMLSALAENRPWRQAA